MSEKKKAAIISLYGNFNYGNKLQNYAVQELLKTEGLDTVNIVNVPCLNNRKKNYAEVAKFYLKGIAQFVRSGDRIIDCAAPEDSIERKKNFLAFNQKIVNSKHFFSFRRLRAYDKYDYFFVGSDQVWNPIYGGLSDLYLLTFTSQKKIAISASFGIESISDEDVARVKRHIAAFTAISVREEAAKHIIEAATGRNDVEVLLDPTMMLHSSDWDRVAHRPKALRDRRYIVSYFLGDVSKTYYNAIVQLAKRENCTVIDLSNSGSEFYNCGPAEFVYLIKNAICVCTDSFHASVFSIMYNKPFAVFNRSGKHDGMGSRLQTLLGTFHMEDAKFTGDIEDIRMDRNYAEANQILESERHRALRFIRDALSK